MPLLVLSQNVPMIVLVPLLAVWFGFGLLPKVVLIMLVCFFPIAVAMLTGLRRADPAMKNYMRMIGAGRRATAVKLELPHAVPFCSPASKFRPPTACSGAVIAEWVGATAGRAQLLHEAVLSAAFERTGRMPAIVMIVAVSMAVVRRRSGSIRAAGSSAGSRSRRRR